MASLGLTRQQRLKTPADFKRVYNSKQWGGSEHHTFNVYSAEKINCPDTDIESGSPRVILGVTVSKKVSNKAVDRNRIKRQIKEFFRLHQHQLLDNASDNIELVITAKPSSIKAGDQQRYQSLENLWQKVLKWHQWHRKHGIESNCSKLIPTKPVTNNPI